MPAKTQRRFDLRIWLLVGAAAIVLLLVLAPAAAATGAGRLLGGLWVSTMSAVFSLIGSLFGAA